MQRINGQLETNHLWPYKDNNCFNWLLLNQQYVLNSDFLKNLMSENKSSGYENSR